MSFYADGCAIDLSEDGRSYTVKSATNEASIVNLTISQACPGFQVGKDGKTYYGTDSKNPWGSMRHAFWPRCNVEGSIITKAGAVDMKGGGFFSHALQGMKPHHAGEAHGPKYGIMRTLNVVSCQVEFCELSVIEVLSNYDGIYNTAFLWFYHC